MPLFRGFRFSLNLTSGKQFSEFSEEASPVSIKGAYKLNNEEFFGLGSYGEPPKKITPSMVKLPPASQSDKPDPDIIRPTKSTGNLNKTSQPPNVPLVSQPPNYKPPNVPPSLRPPNVPQTLSKSTPEIIATTQTSNLPQPLRKDIPEVSSDPKGEKTNNRNSTDDQKNKNEDKIQKRLEKKRQEINKKREKKEALERAKQEKLEKAREKANLKERAKQEKLQKEKQKAEESKAKKENKKKTTEPKPRANNPLAQTSSNPVANTASNHLARNTYNSNTLDSSISKSSGPPPYNEVAESKTRVQNERDSTGNTSFGKPLDEGSTWDMVAQHRAQVSRTTAKPRVQLLDNDRNGPRESLEV